MVAGGTVGKGRHEPSSDSGDPDLDINRAMEMKAKQLKFEKTAPSSKHLGVIPKPKARKAAHAQTFAVAAAATAAEEDTTGSQPLSKTRTRTKPSHQPTISSGRRHHHQPQSNHHPISICITNTHRTTTF